MEQQGAADLTERQVAELIEDDEIDVRHAIGESSLLAVELFLFELVDQFHGGQKPDPPVVVDNCLHTDRGCDVRLAGAGTADQDDVFGLVDSGTDHIGDRNLNHLAAFEFLEVAVHLSPPWQRIRAQCS